MKFSIEYCWSEPETDWSKGHDFDTHFVDHVDCTSDELTELLADMRKNGCFAIAVYVDE